MDDILCIMVAALFISLLSVVMRRDTETFQNITNHTKTFLINNVVPYVILLKNLIVTL